MIVSLQKVVFALNDKIYEFEGLRILGLGGSMRYSGGKYQFTERGMRKE